MEWYPLFANIERELDSARFVDFLENCSMIGIQSELVTDPENLNNKSKIVNKYNKTFHIIFILI